MGSARYSSAGVLRGFEAHGQAGRSRGDAVFLWKKDCIGEWSLERWGCLLKGRASELRCDLGQGWGIHGEGRHAHGVERVSWYCHPG